MPSTMAVGDRLARARALRAELAGVEFSPDDVDAFKRAGRK
jgi:hypothetical protein